MSQLAATPLLRPDVGPEPIHLRSGCLQPKVLVVTVHPALTRHVTRAFVAIGWEVDACPPSLHAVTRMREGRWNMYVVDVDDPLCELFVAQIRLSQPDAVVLALSRDLTHVRLRRLFLERGINNLIARHGGFSASDEIIDESELITTCHKVVSNDIFGMEKYLTAHGAKVHRFRVRTASAKETSLAELERFLSRLACPNRIAADIYTVADELLMNAMYDAPADALGRPKYADLARREDVVLEAHEEVELCFACDGRHVAISVTDLYGRLQRDTILEYLRPNLLGRPAAIEEKEGGAGVGLSMVMNLITQLVFNIEAKRRTEVIALFYIHSGTKAYRVSGRSLNIFTVS